jgi:hypothetical protein
VRPPGCQYDEEPHQEFARKSENAVVLQEFERNARNVTSHFPIQRESATPNRLAIYAACFLLSPFLRHESAPTTAYAWLYIPGISPPRCLEGKEAHP